MKNLAMISLAALLLLAALPAQAGLDLKNQTEVYIPDFDLDQDGRIQRAEMAKYMFFYFDRDGNETLTNGEFGADREIGVKAYDAAAITFIDLDGDGADDAVTYDTDSFLQAVMAGEYDPAAPTIEARDFIDSSMLKLDTDKSKAIEQDEWQKAYARHAVTKPVKAPSASGQDGYAR